MAMLPAIAAIGALASGAIGAAGAMQQGAAAKVAGEAQNYADVAAGKQAVADSQISMINQQRKGDVLSGKFQADAAASGAPGGASIKDIYGQLASQNDTQAGEELFKGQQRQQAFNNMGQNALYMGDAASMAAPWNAAGISFGALSKAASGAKGGDFNFG